jgi:hypothetical protein
MSKGPGSIQRSVLALIDGDPDGAWSIGDLCKLIFGNVEKKHRVSALRALGRMELPGTWAVGREWGSTEYCLCDTCSVESQTRKIWLLGHRQYRSLEKFKSEWPHLVDRARKEAEKAIAYRDASPVAQLDIRIEEARGQLSLCAMIEDAKGRAEFMKPILAHIAELQAERARLATADQSPR